jgi:putative FmdB family regulatory protein
VPTYEYRCTNCGNAVEVFQRIGDDPVTICDVCGGTLRKVFHPAGIVFKGSGFYATDSRSSKSSSQGDGKATEKSGSKEGGSDTKGSAGSKEGGSESSSASSGSGKTP